MLEFCTECCALLNIALPDETKRGDVKAITRRVVQKLYGNGPGRGGLSRGAPQVTLNRSCSAQFYWQKGESLDRR